MIRVKESGREPSWNSRIGQRPARVAAGRSARSGRRVEVARALVAVSILLAACDTDVGRDRAAWLESVDFDDVTNRAGIARETPTYDATIGDFDDDGLPDVYVGNHGAGAVLLENQGDGTFRDMIRTSGIAPGGDQHGTGFADIDGDGDLDLYVALGANRGLGAKANLLYRNEGDGRFVDVAATAAVTDPTGRSRGVAWLDVDADGALDLLLANFASPSRLYRNRGNGTFEDVSEASGIAAHPATHVAWADYDADGAPDVLLRGTPRGLRLLRNEGSSRFRDVTAEVGLERIEAPVQGMAFGDYDADGDLDLALSHGREFTEDAILDGEGTIRFAFFAHDQPTGFDFDVGAGTGADVELYENGVPANPGAIRCGSDRPSASGRFTCSAAQAAAASPSEAWQGFLVWRDPGERRDCEPCPALERWHLRWTGAGDHHLSGIVRGATRVLPIGLQSEVQRGTTLWRNEEGRFALFLESGRGLPVEAAVNGQAVQWADVDNDGWLDLYLVDSGVDGRSTHNVLLLNDQGKSFVLAPQAAGATPESGAGRGVGAHFFDFDRDGRLDLFLTNGWGAPPFDRGPYHLLRNTSASGHWLAVALRGTRSNRHGLGTWITIEFCGQRRTSYSNGGTSYLSQSLTLPHFGLGTCESVSSIHLRWPSGVTQTEHRSSIDRVIDVVEQD